MHHIKKIPAAHQEQKKPVSWVWPSVGLFGLLSSLAGGAYWLRHKLPDTDSLPDKDESERTIAGLVSTSIAHPENSAPIDSFIDLYSEDTGITVTEECYNQTDEATDLIDLQPETHEPDHLPDFAAEEKTQLREQEADLSSELFSQDAIAVEENQLDDGADMADLLGDLPEPQTESSHVDTPATKSAEELVFSLEETQPIEDCLMGVQSVESTTPQPVEVEKDEHLLDFDFSHNKNGSSENVIDLEITHDDSPVVMDDHVIEFSFDPIDLNPK